MASDAVVAELKERLNTVNQFRDSELVRRPKWGDFHFEKAEQDINTARAIAADLLAMDLTHLTGQAAQEITDRIPSVAGCLKRIDEFNLEEGSPSQNRDRIASELQRAVDALHTITSQWIPYLAYKRGDFSESIRRFEEANENAKRQLEETAAYAEGKQQEVDKIVDAAREASASAGVATFTGEFDAEAAALGQASTKWLCAVILLAAFTIISGLVSILWLPLPETANSWSTLSHLVAKVSIVAVLFTGTIWCGRIYRALRHQRSINRHRALSLKTFQAFVHATDDPATRDAVLMAATKSIFANVPTGFVDERASSQDASVNVLEIGKSIGKAVPKRASSAET